MEQQPVDAVVRASAFANGLRKSIANGGRRWVQRPHGAADLDAVLACIDAVRQRLESAPQQDDPTVPVAACIADLRAILEWSTYQSAAIATAQTLTIIRRTRSYAERFGVLANANSRLSVLTDSEESLIENVRAKNSFMTAIAERHPHLGLPQPLIRLESLAPPAVKKPGKLDLIQRLTRSAKEKKRS